MGTYYLFNSEWGALGGGAQTSAEVGGGGGTDLGIVTPLVKATETDM